MTFEEYVTWITALVKALKLDRPWWERRKET
jgi:hypothetical protein